ncbi:hypothetical protein A1332_22995 [Methylomonas methanica]|uniref:Uncharacterized protein n=1 Tax=Methylomonas methanica TaxID=421 RepID=A0A177LTD4_METMH|nr:hypothetical protein A1332_22995 [Methylomonas methanica]
MMRVFTVVATTLCVGCVPFPHTVVRLPAMSGHVVTTGTPVVGAQIFAAYGPMSDPCLTTNQLAITDVSGAFIIEKERQLRFLYAPLVAPISIAGISLCISSGAPPVFADQVMWQPYDAKNIILECDLASPHTFIDINGRSRTRLCQATEDVH